MTNDDVIAEITKKQQIKNLGQKDTCERYIEVPSLLCNTKRQYLGLSAYFTSEQIGLLPFAFGEKFLWPFHEYTVFVRDSKGGGGYWGISASSMIQ